MITITEHQKIDTSQLIGLDTEVLKRRINYNTSVFDVSKINLIKYQFDPDTSKDGFWSYFRIGAEWLNKNQTEALVVVPKIQQIDFIEMFMTCLQSSHPDDKFSEIYEIDLDAKPIRSTVLSSILSPLLVVQFLLGVKQITERGLRKGYVSQEENLKKVKGRIDFRKNLLHNTWAAHKERVFCRYDEFSVDTPENRYLKRALLISSNMISLMSEHKSYSTIYALCNQCLSEFNDVSDSFEDYPNFSRNNKLYRDYFEVLHFARMIISKEDIAIKSHKHNTYDLVPVFRMDMALLFEHYVLAKLRNQFGWDSIIYQARGGNAFKADFLIIKGSLKVIVDSKYTEIYEDGKVNSEYVKQLCGYARDIRLLSKLGINCVNEDHVPIVPCTLIYPTLHYNKRREINLFESPNNRTIKYFTTSVEIPLVLNNGLNHN